MMKLAALASASAYTVSDTTMERHYLNYMAEHGKSYATKEEYLFRLAEFTKKMVLIEEHNSKNTDDAEVALNHMSDWTDDEYKQILGYKGTKARNGTVFTGEGKAIPDSVNWVTAGAVTPVKNQGSCGSCWSFSATGSMEGRYQISTGDLVSFSEQQLMDCSKSQGNNSCEGGLMDFAFTYAETSKMETEAQYPYTAKDAKTCKDGSGNVEIKDFTDVKPKSPSALAAAVAEGPVSIAIDAGSPLFQLYHGGIMKHFCGQSLDHGVLLVGYGTDKGTDYWLVKNSWGPTWGEKGYFRILRSMDGEGKGGVCGLQQDPSFPIM
jgi:C1A family cysteine protease